MIHKPSTTLIIATACLLLSACASTLRTYQAQQHLDANLDRQQAAAQPATPDSKRIHLDLIRKLQERDLYFASLAHLDAWEKSNGATAETQRLRADALRETQQPAAAEAIYKKLLDSSEAAHAWRGLGLLAGAAGDYRRAAANLRQAVQREPANATILGDLGYAQLRSGDLAGARLSLAQAAELAQDNKKILGNLALLLLLSGERAKAEDVMTQAKLSAAGRDAVYRLAADIGNAGTGKTSACREGDCSSLRYATSDDFAMSLQKTHR